MSKRRTAFDYVGYPDVLGHAIVKHRIGHKVSELVDTFWSYLDVDKNETTYCFGKRIQPWRDPTVANVLRVQLNTEQLKEIFYAPDNCVETETTVLEADEGEPWFLAWKGSKISHYYVRENSESKIWKQHKNEVTYKNGFEAGHTPSCPGELREPFAVRKKKIPKQRKGATTKTTVAALNIGYLHF